MSPRPNSATFRHRRRQQRRRAPGVAVAPDLSRPPFARLSHRARALLLALLLAFSWQSFVAETHRHYEAAAEPTAAARAGTPHQRGPGDTPANCWICREVTHVGDILLPPQFVIAPAPHTAYWAAAAQPDAPMLRQRSHAWLSRAPPQPLHA